MLTLDECQIIEGEIDADERTFFTSIQRAINEGAWTFQGSYGRTMMAAIETGRCLLGHRAFLDAYGNRVPSRHEVLPSAKGSREFVLKAHGAEWAEAMATIE